MSDEDNFFAAPPAEPPTDAEDAGAAPILLGEPPQDSFGDDAGYAAAPSGGDEATAYLGDVQEGGAAPIVLGPGPSGEEAEDDDVDAFGGAAMVTADGGPSPMQEWNAAWQVTLQQRKEEENARKAELLAAAEAARAQLQAEREQKREARMAKNREDEQVKLEAIEADLENDNSWQRVCKMVELSHDSSQQTTDVKRMRDILIGLKNDTTKAVELST